MATVADILTLINSLSSTEKDQLKTLLINDSPRINRIEQLIADERFTGGLVCPICGCIGHVSRNGHMYQGMVIGKMESKDISARIVENPLLLTPIPLRQEHEKTLTFGKSMWNV